MHLHQNSISHRDIKPGNILCGSDGRLYITDFGISRTRDELQNSTKLSGGTHYYVMHNSPQYKKPLSDSLWNISRQNDIYATLIVNFQLNSGEVRQRVPLCQFEEQNMKNIVTGKAKLRIGLYADLCNRMRAILVEKGYSDTYAREVETMFNTFDPLNESNISYEDLLTFKGKLEKEIEVQEKKQSATEKTHERQIKKAHQTTIQRLNGYQTSTESKKAAIAKLCEQLKLAKTASEYEQLSPKEKEELGDTIREILVDTNGASSPAKRFQHFCHDTVANYIRACL